MTNGEIVQKVFNCEVCEPIIEDDIIHVIFADKKESAIGFDWSWWNAEYKEPTTRNCSGCKYSKDNHNSGTEECHLCMWENQYTPTTKNDLAQERYQDLIEYFGSKEVAKAILGSRKEFKAWLERLRWNVKKANELARELEQIKGTTKNDLGVDCISREAVLALFNKSDGYNWEMSLLKSKIRKMPSVTPQEPRKGHWIDTNYHHYYNDGDIETTELRCSCCNEEVEWDIELLHKPYYCENCGADIREVKE